jgi:hypothetical protein
MEGSAAADAQRSLALAKMAQMYLDDGNVQVRRDQSPACAPAILSHALRLRRLAGSERRVRSQAADEAVKKGLELDPASIDLQRARLQVCARWSLAFSCSCFPVRVLRTGARCASRRRGGLLLYF